MIMHVDLDAFYCAVEENENPSLRGKPFAVGGKPDERGVVTSCSYSARARGVRSAMPMARALRLCRNLIIVPVHHALYLQRSMQVMEVLQDLSPLVEPISIDEAFLDISDMQESPHMVAQRLQQRIKSELNLPCSIGIASSKLVAKIATEVGKSAGNTRGEAPCGLTIVPAGTEAEFLAPLPADMLWGVGPKTSARLAGLGIQTIGDIAGWSHAELVRLFGQNGRDLWHHANAIDNRPVSPNSETRSVSQETTFRLDVHDLKILEKTLHDQAREVSHQLRKKELAGRTIRLKIRWQDFTTRTRQTTLSGATDNAEEVFQTALKLLHAVRDQDQPVRLIGVGVSGLGAPIRQLSLWDAGSERQRRLQAVVDSLQKKYGRRVILHADKLAHTPQNANPEDINPEDINPED